MMKTLFLIIPVLLFTGCSGLSPIFKDEINRLPESETEAAQVSIGYEPTGLRIDILRQTYCEDQDDSTSDTKDEPYHHLGFDLGNGLFFDLNENLSFRLDRLLSIEEGKDYRLEESSYSLLQKNPSRRYYFREDGEICQSRRRDKKQKRNCRRLVEKEDQTHMMRGRQICYTLNYKDKGVEYDWPGIGKSAHQINQIAESHFELARRKRWKETFQARQDTIELGNEYRLIQSDNQFDLYRKHRRRAVKISSFKIGRDKIYIYNLNYRGQKIERFANRLEVYNNQHRSLVYARMDR